MISQSERDYFFLAGAFVGAALAVEALVVVNLILSSLASEAGPQQRGQSPASAQLPNPAKRLLSLGKLAALVDHAVLARPSWIGLDVDVKLQTRIRRAIGAACDHSVPSVMMTVMSWYSGWMSVSLSLLSSARLEGVKTHK